MLETESFQLNATDCAVVAHVLRVCGKAGLLDTALEIYEKVKRHPTLPNNVMIRTALMFACGKQGDVNRAMGIFEEMLEQSQFVGRDGKPVHDVKPNVITYTTLIQLFSDNEKHHRALEIYEMMKDHGVQPNLLTYNQVLSAAAAVEGYERVVDEVMWKIKDLKLRANLITLHALLVKFTRGDPALIRANHSIQPLDSADASSGSGSADEHSEEKVNERDEDRSAEQKFEATQNIGTSTKEEQQTTRTVPDEPSRASSTASPSSSSSEKPINLRYAVDQFHRLSHAYRLKASATAYYILLDACMRSPTAENIQIGAKLVAEARMRLEDQAGPQLVELMDRVMAASQRLGSAG